MVLVDILEYINNQLFSVPSIILFFGTSLFLTFKTGFIQIRALPRFFSLIFHGVRRQKGQKDVEGMTTFQALFTAMATTIGMGNVVSPSLAIIVGGPGALFWLLFYMFFGSVTKYTEVTFALATRKVLPDGFVMGGPMQYLKEVSSFLANWYGWVIVVVLISWSGAQANTLANIMALEGVPHWWVGLALAIFTVVALLGGAHRVGALASKMVPFMFVLYVGFASSILFANPLELWNAIKLMWHSAWSPAAAMGGFLGASVLRALKEGMFRGIFITEAGLGTSSIPHSLADTKCPTDQGVLAMGSILADAILSALSGLLVLVTNVWSYGTFRTTLVYEVFKLNSPGIGQYVLLLSVSLFVLTTVMGNSFNGMQSLGVVTKDNKVLMGCYIAVSAFFIFAGSMLDMRLLWNMIDILVMFVAVPNLIGLLILAFKHKETLRLRG